MEKQSVSQGSSTSTEETSHGEGTHPVVPFGPEDKANFCKEHELSLFAKVLGKTFERMRLHIHLNWLWDLAGTLVVVALENDFFLLKFPTPAAYQKALEGIPWLIDRHHITLHPWVQNFKPSDAIITKVVVWIRLPELPIEYYAQVAFTRIAEPIGKLVKVDPITQRKSVCKFARLCVEIDITFPLTNHIELNDGLLQTIIYEGLVCDHCGRFGHLHLSCPDLLPIGTELTHQAPCYPSPSYNSPSYGLWPRHWVPYHKATPSTGSSASGSRFQVLEQDEQENVAKKTNPGITSSMLEQILHLQLGEGTSSSSRGKNKVTSPTTETTDVPLDSTQLPKIEESTSCLFETAKVLPDFCSSEPCQGHKANPPPPIEESTTRLFETAKMLPDFCSSEPCQGHKANPPPLIEESTTRLFETPKVLPDFCSSEPRQGLEANLPPPPLSSTFPPSSSISNNTPPPSAPSPLVTSTKPTDSPNRPPLIPQQPSTSNWSMGDQLYLQGVQKSTQNLEINTEPYDLKERSTEGCPRVLTIDSKISEMAIDVNVVPLSTGIANQHHTSIDPTAIDHTNYPVRPSCKKKLIIWNCRKAGERKVIQAVKDLCEQYQPSILLLFVTGIHGTDAANAIRHLGFSCSYIVDPTNDCTSGVWLLWREEEVNINLTTASYWIHAAVEFLPKGHDLIFHGADAADEKQLDCSGVFGIDSDEDSVS